MSPVTASPPSTARGESRAPSSPNAADQARLADLVPAAEELFERHLKVSKEWFPHELVPWSRGRDFEPDEEWDPTTSDIPGPVRSALVLNLLTEDNLPYYFHAIATVYGSDGVWGEWARRWTAEEHRHSIVLRDWLTVTRAVDLVELERARMAHVSAGFHADADTRGVCHGLVYVTLQELATRVTHRNTGSLLQDAAGGAINARVAADENLHYLFYRDVATAALEQDPSAMMLAIDAEVRGFQM
ncbi:MAG: acyl-ACP desaturase, partial [Acidimicrobiales bacterium]